MNIIFIPFFISDTIIFNINLCWFIYSTTFKIFINKINLIKLIYSATENSATDSPLLIVNNSSISNGKSVADSQN